ncbi:hypothetical protein LQT97_09965 [Brucella pseudogrignonensis]|jgi:hypothetical protein|uniref:hypothetical protein n=1 Tax=Brucella pseudogrignonensis TaxID=419475 RepID=UPI000DE4654B|nr:hypothetical protein [Brucella pseudogrignonensis]KAB2691592.1 hypothetical protein F9K82_06585 [Brucella pseudogrignonensis]MCD4511564.1 hypothetical protein [Brucella pseudogrignonensis]
MDRTVPVDAALLLVFTRLNETGKADHSSYDVIYGHNERKVSKKSTSMSIDDLICIEPVFTKRFQSPASIHARYSAQAKVELRLCDRQVMDPDLPYRLGYHLAIRRGYNDFISGRISRT